MLAPKLSSEEKIKRLLYLKQAELWEAFEAAINIVHPLKHQNKLLYSTVDGLEDFEGLTFLKMTNHTQVETLNLDAASGSGLCWAVLGTQGTTLDAWRCPCSCFCPWN